jgi:hypothetical protein
MAIAGQLQFGGRLCEAIGRSQAIGWNNLLFWGTNIACYILLPQDKSYPLELTIIDNQIVINCLKNTP